MNSRATDGHLALLSFRRLLAILLGVLGLLVGGLFVVASLQVTGSAAQTHAENRRISSFLLADSLRQSSNDLTNMVRLYVATGHTRYRDYYGQILQPYVLEPRHVRRVTTARSGIASSPRANASFATAHRSR